MIKALPIMELFQILKSRQSVLNFQKCYEREEMRL